MTRYFSWTPERVRILRAEYPLCHSVHDLARRLGVGLTTVRSKASDLGLRRAKGIRSKWRWTADREDTLRRMWGRVPVADIAREADTTQAAVRIHASRVGLSDPEAQTERTCIRCKKWFMSRARSHRICGRCRAQKTKHGADHAYHIHIDL